MINRLLASEDRLCIGNFGKDIVIEPDDFTSDRDAPFKVLRGDLQNDGPTPLWNAIDRAIDKLLLEKGRSSKAARGLVGRGCHRGATRL